MLKSKTMSTTRTHIGKIGRLSKARRTELAHRLEDSQPGTDIVHWLNAQPDVQAILKAQFDGRPVTEQNLSDWKHSGHVEWLRREAARESALQLVERSDDLVETAQEGHLGDRLALVLAEQMSRLALALLEAEPDLEKRWQRLCAIHREVSQLRRDDHRAICTAIKEERFNREASRADQAEADRLKQELKDRQINLLLEGENRLANMAIFGTGEAGQRRAEMLYRLKCDLPCEDVMDGTWPPPGTAAPRASAAAKEKARRTAGARPRKTPANPGKSSLIKADPVEKNEAPEPAPAK